MSEDRGRLRISNAERDQAVARLQLSLDEGRLDLSEFDERTQAVYGAKTRAELDLVFEDLPSDRSGEVAAHRPVAESAGREGLARRIRRSVPSAFHPLILVGSITTTIWLLSSVASGGLQYFWPAWPLGIMAAIGIATWLTGDDDDDDDDGCGTSDEKS